jgi:predicted transcriptional regulator
MNTQIKHNIGTMRVENLMVAAVHAVQLNMTIKEVAEMFLNLKINGAPVVDQSGVVISVISQSDLIQFLALDAGAKQVNQMLGKLPKPGDVVSVLRTDTFKEVFKQFLLNPVRRIIVVDGSGHLQGLVAKSDLLRAFLQHGG